MLDHLTGRPERGPSAVTTVLSPALALFLAAGGAACGVGGEARPDGGSSDHNEVLGRLGVQTDLGPRTDEEGNPVREGYNPLGARRRLFTRQAEIYVAGVTLPGGGRQTLMEDGTKGYPVLYTGGSDDALTSHPKASTSGDFDADGREEVALLILNTNTRRLYLRVIEDKAESHAFEEKDLVTYQDISPILARGDGDKFLKLDIASGDIDGDDRDELVVAAMGDLWVLDDRSADHATLFRKSFPLAAAGYAQYLRVAAGDLDGDGKASPATPGAPGTMSTTVASRR